MAYYVGDIPAEDLVIEPARGDEPIALAPFTEADSTVVLRTFDGEIVDADFLLVFDTGDPDDIDRVILEWPTDESPFRVPGLHTLTVTLAGAERREQLAPVYLVAQAENGWHTLDSARAEWNDAPLQDVRLFQVLELARQQVTEYAPALAVDAPIPGNYRQGQLMQARNLLNAGTVSPDGGIGEGDFVLRPFPLDWMVKQILRPQRAVPTVG
jgi:hypothetical protein